MKLQDLFDILQETQQKIKVSQPFITGGTPRDRVLKKLKHIADIDITTGDDTVHYLASEFASKLKKNYNVMFRTMPDGHSTVFIGNIKIDFSSNFHAPNIQAILKKQGIEHPTSMQEEVYSRDFTCNALLLSLDLQTVLDPTKHGLPDIKNKLITTCLAPEVTLTCNRNRVVRAIYLACKLDFTIDPKIVAYVQAHPESLAISTPKSLNEKLGEAFNFNPDKAAHYLTEMKLWQHIPITKQIHPYYQQHLSGMIKKSYFQGGGGVNEPQPGKQKYPVEKATKVEPRFKTPFFNNYDLYDVSENQENSPGDGFFQNMQHYKSVGDFLKQRRERNKDQYCAGDEMRMGVKLQKQAIDFDIDTQIKSDPILEDQSSVGYAAQLGGLNDPYTPPNDWNDRGVETLNYGNDLDPDLTRSQFNSQQNNLEDIINKYLNPSEPGIFGLPDGILPKEDEDPSATENDRDNAYSTTDSGNTCYQGAWWI